MGATQLFLLDRGASSPEVDADFGQLDRAELGDGAWVDYVPGWVRGDGLLFSVLRNAASWSAGRRRMYERIVAVPRLTAKLPADGGHPIVASIASVLSARYRTCFDAISLALYRDGHDSVAWHQDKGLREVAESTLALVSLGEPRPFRLRPVGGGASLVYRCGWGGLLVLGGAVQRHWQHAVPKAPCVGPRMVVMLRCTRDTRLA